MLQARSLAIDVAARRVLSDASFTVAEGDKVGLVGRNGAGKTSLLKVLAGEDDAAAGVVLRRGTLGYVPQNPRPRAEAAATAQSHILSGKGLDRAAAHLADLHRRLETDHSPAMIERYSEAEERYRHAGGYSAESEARRIVTGLGLRLDRVDLALGVLSGGERRRVELARVLFAEADLLLLDEPTNHLDTDAKTWLMGFLRDYRGAVIVVSHDLALLDSSITRVLHLDSGRLIEYRGTYSQYQAARAMEEKRLTSLAERQDRLLVMGLNGAGKTSLLRILAGESEPNSGSFRLGHGVSLGYYAQEHEGIRAGVSVLAHMREQAPEVEERVLRALLGMFGLTGDIARQDAGTLSGGEKTKLALAQLVAGRHNLLLLDEPTNNLDPPSRVGVALALAAWPGTMVIVSHDTEFVDALKPGRVIFMPEGRVDYWDDELLDVVSMA